MFELRVLNQKCSVYVQLTCIHIEIYVRITYKNELFLFDTAQNTRSIATHEQIFCYCLYCLIYVIHV